MDTVEEASLEASAYGLKGFGVGLACSVLTTGLVNGLSLGVPPGYGGASKGFGIGNVVEGACSDVDGGIGGVVPNNPAKGGAFEVSLPLERVAGLAVSAVKLKGAAGGAGSCLAKDGSWACPGLGEDGGV